MRKGEPHTNAEVSVELDGYEKHDNYHYWGLESSSEMAQLVPGYRNRGRDGYKFVGVDAKK
jgi:hypothetical protein